MVRLSSFFALAAVLWPMVATAQTQPDLAGILERLDRLETENRALAAEVRNLRAKIDGTGASRSGPDAETVPDPAADHPVSPGGTLEDKVEVNSQRIEEQAQTKVEASHKFPVRLAGMVLFNAFTNSRQNGGFDY